jgi:aspartate oxidase
MLNLPATPTTAPGICPARKAMSANTSKSKYEANRLSSLGRFFDKNNLHSKRLTREGGKLQSLFMLK